MAANGYPLWFFERHLKETLQKLLCKENKGITNNELPRCVVQITYIDKASIDFCKRLRRLLPPSVKKNVIFVFRCSRLRSMFPIKWPTPKELVSSVVYLFSCAGDQRINYIGETRRHLGVRLKEHATKPSPIFDHLLSCEVCSRNSILRQTKILYRTPHVRIAEALLIKENNPSLNIQLAQKGSSYFLSVF